MDEQAGTEKRRRSYRSGARIAEGADGPRGAAGCGSAGRGRGLGRRGGARRVRPRRPGPRGARDAVHPSGVGPPRCGRAPTRAAPGRELPGAARPARRPPDPRLRDDGRQPVHHRLGAPPRPRAGLPGLRRVQRAPDRRRRGPRRDPRRREPVPARRDRPGRGPAVVARGLVVPDPGARPSGRGAASRAPSCRPSTARRRSRSCSATGRARSST